jgi:GTPase SAR1 family protein
MGLPHLNICFVGDAKAGKSTSINNFLSVLSALQRLQTHAFGTNLNEPGTTCYAKYPLTLIGDVVDDLKYLPISLSDTPGFTDKYIDKIETLIPFIAQGRVPEGWKILDNPAFLPLTGEAPMKDWIHLFAIIIPADAITNPVKMEHFRRIERAIRAEPPNATAQAYPKYSNVVYFVTQMDDATRGGDVLLSSHPNQFDASQLWDTYKKKLRSPAGVGNADAFPIINVTETFKEIPDTHLSLFLEAWSRILSAVRTNVAQWKLK